MKKAILKKITELAGTHIVVKGLIWAISLPAIWFELFANCQMTLKQI